MTMRPGSAPLLVLMLCALVGIAVGQEAPPPQLTNGGMEDGDAGQAPPGWSFYTNCGATAVLDEHQPFAGGKAAAIDASQATGSAKGFSNLMQSLDAKPWQGKRVRFRAAVEVGALPRGASVQMWLRVDRPNDEMGAFDNMGDRPIQDTTWAQHDIVLDVAADAVRVVCGMFVIGNGSARLDDATLEVVAADVPTTGAAVAAASRGSMPAAVAKALAEADKAPQQPFFTPWLALPALALLAFLFALWPTRSGNEPGAGRRFAIRFTIAYWLVYCLPGPFSQLLPVLGSLLEMAHQWLDQTLVAWTARLVFGIDGELVPPNGSGDTTFNYISQLNGLVLAIVLAAIWSVVGPRLRPHVMLDLLRSYLRYVLAFAMLGYGLAKVTMEQNQFPVVGDWQLQKTWGDSSPMNVVWAFMGSSRPYTIFAGSGEVLAALLLVWRRTGTLGALVAIGVVTNIVMINFCYDVPVKLYSSHLLVMAVLIALPDMGRLLDVLVFDRAPARAAADPWSGPQLRWARRVVKAAVLVVGFGLPLTNEAIATWRYLSKPVPAASPVGKAEDEPLLLRRGFRWINEVPFNR